METSFTILLVVVMKNCIDLNFFTLKRNEGKKKGSKLINDLCWEFPLELELHASVALLRSLICSAAIFQVETLLQ